MANIRLERGTPVRRSVRGAKGFFYPDMDGKCLMIRKNCDCQEQTGWNDFAGWKAVVVPSSAMSEKDRYEPFTDKMVVWVKKNG